MQCCMHVNLFTGGGDAAHLVPPLKRRRFMDGFGTQLKIPFDTAFAKVAEALKKRIGILTNIQEALINKLEHTW